MDSNFQKDGVVMSAEGGLETYKTNETYSPTNAEFLSAIFGEINSDIRPVIVRFNGDPAKVKRWGGTPWNKEKMVMSSKANNYYSLATFHPDDSGDYHRQKKYFSALYVIVLDDVGTKIKHERVTLRPSYKLETSSGNFQVGFILKEALQDVAVAERLMNAIIAAELCDPGLSGPAARIVRLPEGVNGKSNPAFQCRMHEWNPDLRYSIEELVDGLQVDMNTERTKTGAKKKRVESPDGGDIHIPCPTENKVIKGLQSRGFYKSPLGDGKHDITCPWVSEHTGGVDGGTAYFEPDGTYPIGGFKCLHGHCAHRHIRDLLQFMGIEANAARMKPIIRIIPGEIHNIVNMAEQELAKTGKYYQRSGLIVTVSTDPGTKETSVRNISLPALVAAQAGAATWEKYDKNVTNWVRTDPPPRHTSVLHDAESYKHLLVLNGLARQPYLRPDGTLVTKAGYDAETGMFGVFNEKDFSVADKPTKADAEASLQVLNGLLEEFPFAQPADKAAAQAAILTGAIRPSLPTAPMFHAKAPIISSGKSFLCKTISAFASPQRAAPTTFPQDDEECRKFLLAEFMRSAAIIEFDNLTGDLVPHKSLCSALTEEFYSGRILGLNKTANASTRVLFLSSGNNVSPVGDMARRCVTINLDPACEVPAARTFKNPELLSNLYRERGRYVSAALTLIRAWIVAGRPKQACKALGGYSAWSDLCRQPLLWLGQPDPATSVFEAMTEDPDREILGRLLEAWHTHFGNSPAMVREAVDADTLAPGGKDLQEVINDIAGERGEINRHKLGRWILRHASRIVDDRRFVRASGKRSAVAWFVELVS